MSMEVSVIKIYDVFIVTLPSEPSDNTIELLQEEILNKMEKHQAKGVIMDVSLVDTLDSFFARYITETFQMIALMGGKTVISGMRPSVAITATQLGLMFNNVHSTLEIDDALDMFVQNRW